MLGIKKLDWFVMKGYSLLFCATFFICLFICIMQFLWRYLDDLVGKGLSLDVLAEFFFWAALTLIPMALPLAILLAALITFGNFGEKFELTAMKAAGVSLLKVMRPLILMSLLTCGVSFYFQNVVAPHAQIKLWTLLLSMKQTSPELDIPEGQFYDQITGYNVYVKKKNKNTGILKDVMIYSFAEGFNNSRIFVADSAKLAITADKKFLQLDLFSGDQFENLKSQGNTQLHNMPFRRESFSHKRTLIEFNSNFEKMDEGFMTRQYMSKDMGQLQRSIDSLNLQIDSMGRTLYNDVKRTVYQPQHLQASDSIRLQKSRLRFVNIDSAFNVSTAQQREQYIASAKSTVIGTDWNLRGVAVSDTQRFLRRHEIEWHKKLALSLSCIIFFFIGAPLGSIIRKGGLGTPMVVAVMFFVVYFIIDNTGQKFAREGIWLVWLGVWLSSLCLAPIGVFLTYKANNDSVVFNAELYRNWFMHLAGIRDTRHIFKKEVIIDDPNYPELTKALSALATQCETYLVKTILAKVPNYFTLWRNRAIDEPLIAIQKEMERIIEELNNSKDGVILDRLNRFPILAVHAHRCPFNAPWLNDLIGVVLPAGLFFYFRIWRFRIRLYRDMKQITATCNELLPHVEKYCTNPQ